MSNKEAYFDNAATTYPKPEAVYEFADSFYRNRGGNLGRGNNKFARGAGEVALATKTNLKEIFGCANKQVAFTSSATDALNKILLGLSYSSDSVVYVTPFEHNAVTRPLNHLQQEHGFSLQTLDFNKTTLLPSIDSIEKQFSENPPSLVVMTHASNVCGAVVPILDICQLAKRFNAITVIDMSQSAGLISLELGSELIDFAVFAGHKTLMAPFGIGGFVFNKGAVLKPVMFGGNGINSIEQDMPKDIVQMIEIGSQNIYAIAGLKASTDWLIANGTEYIYSLECERCERLLSLLREYSNVKIIADKMECQRIGVVSCLFDVFSPDEIEQILSRQGIAVRSGLQCSPLAHKFLGTLPAGTVRFSVSALTTDADFSLLEAALETIADNS